MYDPRLLKKINQGRSFALIGSGASAELGYPSWPDLAAEVIVVLKGQHKLTDESAYSKYLSKGQLPELFTQAERDLGSRDELISLLRTLVRPKPGCTHFVYDMLTNWPFACYLTTNWDNEIQERLKAKGSFFKALQNTKEDFSLIRNDASGLIVKLHSDLDHPALTVITSRDYQRLMLPDWSYFRDRIRAMFEMFDVFIIGLSLNDPDISLILTIAKDSANAQHPVFLIAPDLTKSEQSELLERYNIIALSYDNSDGNHAQLRRTLQLFDRFIIPRKQRVDLCAMQYSVDELEAVQAVAVYRRFAIASESELPPLSYLGPLVLAALWRTGVEVDEADLKNLSPLSSAMETESVRALIPSVLESLAQEKLLNRHDRKVSLSEIGVLRVDDLAGTRKLEEDQAFGQFVVDLASEFKDLTALQEHDLAEKLKDTLVCVFKQRGLAMANAIFGGRSVDHEVLGDVFNAVSSAAGTIKERELGVAFMFAAHKFLLEPDESQKKYLASISQGFFLYHLFGLDPNCAKIRRDIFEHTIWWCDSNTLLPLIAIGCANHQYARDLFKRLQALKAHTLTTGRLLREAAGHLDWFQRFYQREIAGSSVPIEAATEKAGYEQNLFLDGFIRLSAEGKANKVSDYIKLVAPYGTGEAGMKRLVEEYKIKVLSVSDMEGYKDDDTRDVLELSHQVLEARSKSGTFKSAKQVDAEAEILQMIRRLQDHTYRPPADNMTFERSYFLSQSRVLDRIPPAEPISWTPEALYRYILALPGESLDPDLMQRCMLQEYFASGVVIVDAPRYEKFFGSAINVANTTYAEERDKYLQEFQEVNGNELDKTFHSTPDLEKPFFVQQMGWQLARREHLKLEAAEARVEVALEQAAAVTTELISVKQGRDADWRRKEEARRKQLEAEVRNARDPKHERKRERQRKKRTRKGKR